MLVVSGKRSRKLPSTHRYDLTCVSNLQRKSLACHVGWRQSPRSLRPIGKYISSHPMPMGVVVVQRCNLSHTTPSQILTRILHTFTESLIIYMSIKHHQTGKSSDPLPSYPKNMVYFDDLWYLRETIYGMNPLMQRFTSVWKIHLAGYRGYRAKFPLHPSYAPQSTLCQGTP